tara:strand:- start:3535 stop:4035 length:501 start_codon:yes stop_codon:yes gene_type:complete
MGNKLGKVVNNMNKINLMIIAMIIFPTAADDFLKENKIKKLHPSSQEDAYVVSFNGSPNLFTLKEIKVKKPKKRDLKKLKFISDDDEFAIKVFDKNRVELIAIGIGNPFYATYEHIGYEDRKYMGGPISSANIQIAIPLELEPAIFVISKRNSVGKFNDFQEILIP